MDFGSIDPEGGADTFDFEHLGPHVLIPLDGDTVVDGVPVRMNNGHATLRRFPA